MRERDEPGDDAGRRVQRMVPRFDDRHAATVRLRWRYPRLPASRKVLMVIDSADFRILELDQ